MKKGITKAVKQARASYEELEALVRMKVQDFVQEIVEEEITAFLGGREKSERIKGIDAQKVYRNGYGKPRHLTLMNGTITIRRPRLRGAEGFESKVLPLFVRRTKEVGELLPELYLHGLAKGDFDLAMRGLLGEGAPLSPASIGRLKAKWQIEYEQWKKQNLSELKVVYQWADGIYVKAGLERDKAALLVIIGATVSSPGHELLVVAQDYRKATSSAYNSDIYGARVDGKGVLVDTNGFAICTNAGSQFHPAVAADGTNYLVVWQDYDLAGSDILGARVSPEGSVLDTNALVICHAANSQAYAVVAAENGAFLVAWQDYRETPGHNFEWPGFTERACPATVQ